MNGLYVGTFDPITVGHIDIIKRASEIFDTLYVMVANNSSKHTMIPINYREHLTKLAIQSIPKVEYLKIVSEGTTPDIMKANNIKYLVRGARNPTDLSYEQTLYHDYRKIDPNIEEILLWSQVDVSSTFIRECVKYSKWDIVRKYVPIETADELIHFLHG